MTTPPALPPELSPRGRGTGARAVRAPQGATDVTPAPPVRGAGWKRFGRALSWVASVTSLLVLLGAGGGYLYVNHQFGSIRKLGGLCLSGCDGQAAETGSVENFLLVGSDSRAGANSTGDLAGTAGQGTDGARSDTTLLVHLSANRQKVVVLSFPRDMYVTVPQETLPGSSKVVGGFKGKFNTAYALGNDAGGTDSAKASQYAAYMVSKQVTALTGLPVDHYVEVDFAGFQSIVDALGGVEVCVTRTDDDRNRVDGGPVAEGGSGWVSGPGRFTINGERALQFVRTRETLPRGDLDRINRQQRFLSAMFRKVKSAGTLLNPFKLNSFISSLAKDVTIDSGTSVDDLVQLAQGLRNLDPNRVEFLTVPTSGGFNAGPQVGSVLSIDAEKARTIFQAIHDDRDPQQALTAPPTPSASAGATGGTVTIPPSQVALTVENGTGESGKARSTADELAALGFRATVSSTVPTRSGSSATEVRYGSGRADSARTVAAAVPGAVLVPDDSQGNQALVLVVGTSYSGARAVTVGQPVSSAPAPAPTSAAPATSAAAPRPTASAAPRPTARPTDPVTGKPLPSNVDPSDPLCGP